MPANITDSRKVDPKDRQHLTQLNEAYTECLKKSFWPQFLAGQAVNIDEVCIDERVKMTQLDSKVYPRDFFSNH